MIIEAVRGIGGISLANSGTPPGVRPNQYRIPGGLRGLRPPATFFATLRVALGQSTIEMPLGEGQGDGLSRGHKNFG